MNSELERLYEDRDMLEGDISLDEDRVREIEISNPDYEHDDEWNYLVGQIQSMENEVAYINVCIEEVLDMCAE